MLTSGSVAAFGVDFLHAVVHARYRTGRPSTTLTSSRESVAFSLSPTPRSLAMGAVVAGGGAFVSGAASTPTVPDRSPPAFQASRPIAPAKITAKIAKRRRVSPALATSERHAPLDDVLHVEESHDAPV